DSSGLQGKGIMDCPGVRLPTEAEWEYAYRSGSKTPFYHDGEISACQGVDPMADKVAWYMANSGGTNPFAQLLDNTWGVFDMSGNVWEWCNDWYQEDLGPLPQTDPMGPVLGTNRTLRGGAFSEEPENLRAAARFLGDPRIHQPNIGFRIVRTK
ncbi:MAG: formylglycine-generating enzyme family protein, partial [Pseudomonadota bacterium]